MALQTTLAECGWPSREDATIEGLALGCAWMCGCNMSLDGSKEAACLSLPLLTACPTKSAEGSGGGTCQPSPAATARALPPAKPAANAVHTPALGCKELQHQQRQSLREKEKIAGCGKGDREGWGTEGKGRAGKQLDAFLFYFFKWRTFVLCSLLQHKRGCWGPERKEGGINRKVKGAFEKENADQGGKTWNCFKANLPLTMRSSPVSLNMLCNLL